MNSPARLPISELPTEMFRRILFGGGAATGVAILYGFVRLMEQDPKDGFALLRQWGPWFLIALVAMYFTWDLGKRVLTSMATLADGMQTLSASVKVIADKDDRQYDEMRRMSQYSAQQSERFMSLLLEQGEQLKSISGKLDRMGRNNERDADQSG